MAARVSRGARKTPTSSILVTGDVVADQHVYQGDQLVPGDKSKRGTRRGTEALVGLNVERGRFTNEGLERVRQHLAHHLELLAEAEHVGWMEAQRDNGLRYGPARTDATHPLMVPYRELPPAEQAKDRDAITHDPDVLARAGIGLCLQEGRKPRPDAGER